MPDQQRLTRRALLGATGASLLAGGLAGCGGSSAPAARPGTGTQRIRYGRDHADQYADLRLPQHAPTATIVLLHGGFWLQQYPARQMDEMAEVLRAAGHAVWNVEYRRLDGAGGWPATFEDVATAMDLLAKLTREQTGIDPQQLLRRVVTVGHSAGGHLAAWAASRSARTPGGAPAYRPDATISLSGVLNLTLGDTSGLGGGVIEQLMGGSAATVPAHYALGDPTLLVPAHGPVYAVQADSDEIIPPTQASTYVAAANAAGGRAAQVGVPGGHIALISPSGPAWPRIDQLITSAARGEEPSAVG